MSFQRELVDLLDSFELSRADHFDRLPPDRKHYFVTRLYKCFERGLKNAATELAQVEGLKLSYARELVGVSNDFHDNFFKKLAFYSSHAVVTCPIREAVDTPRTSKRKRMSGRERLDTGTVQRLREQGLYVFGDVRADHGDVHIQGRAYVVERAAVLRLIETVVGLRAALAEGLVHVLPGLPDNEDKLRADFRRSRVVSGNFSRPSLVQQFSESLPTNQSVRDVAVTRLYLPHLSHVGLQEIVAIRNRERSAYDEFQAALSDFVFTTSGNFSEQRLEDYLKRMDEALRAIRASMDRVKREYDARSRDMLIGYVAVGIVALIPGVLGHPLAPFVTSTLSALDFLKSRSDYRTSQEQAAAGEFYVAWRLDEVSRNTGA